MTADTTFESVHMDDLDAQPDHPAFTDANGETHINGCTMFTGPVDEHRWADGRGWPCSYCIDAEPRINMFEGLGDPNKLYGAGAQAKADAAAKRDMKAKTRKVKNAASERQMEFLNSLMLERGLGDENPADYFFNSANDIASHDGTLTKKEASYCIDTLLKMPVTVIVGDDPESDQTVEDIEYDEAAILAAAAPRADRKYTPDEITPELVKYATDWAAGWKGGGFEFMEDMRSKAKKGGLLSAGQAKGVMNCVLAGIRRGDVTPPGAAPAKGLDLSSLPSGWYAVPGDDENRLKVKVRWVEKGNWEGWCFVDDGAYYGAGTKYGRQAPGKLYSGKIEEQLAKILADPAAAVARYGEITNKCSACGRPLEDEESVKRGLGPICAGKFW